MCMRINVAYCCSNLFSEVCGVSIVSLFENNKDLDSIYVYILEDRISKDNKERFLSLAKSYSRKIVFIPMPSPEEFYYDSRFTFDSVGRTFGRMIWGDVLPRDVHKLLSLDCDTMILGNLRELWCNDMDGKPIGGVDDCMGKTAMKKTQHLSGDMVHCNAGMYLIDLDLWREEGWTELFKQYIVDLFDKGIALGGYEEEVITHTLSRRFYVFEPQYNLMTLEQVMTYRELMNFRQPERYYTEDEIKYALDNPVITHTTNLFYVKKRVFESNSDHPQRDNYLKYRDMSPWKNDETLEMSYSFRHQVIKSIWHLLPRRLSFGLARFVRNEIRPLLRKKRDDI